MSLTLSLNACAECSLFNTDIDFLILETLAHFLVETKFPQLSHSSVTQIAVKTDLLMDASYSR